MSTPRARETLWNACMNADGHVFCNICDLEVTPGAAWDESHLGIPKALQGHVVGIAHRYCNRLHGAKVVTPMVAKTKRQRRKHLGISAPGLGHNPLPGGRRSKWKKKLNGTVVLRYPEQTR